jgi:glutaredoxin 2
MLSRKILLARRASQSLRGKAVSAAERRWQNQIIGLREFPGSAVSPMSSKLRVQEFSTTSEVQKYFQTVPKKTFGKARSAEFSHTRAIY